MERLYVKEPKKVIQTKLKSANLIRKNNKKIERKPYMTAKKVAFSKKRMCAMTSPQAIFNQVSKSKSVCKSENEMRSEHSEI